MVSFLSISSEDFLQIPASCTEVITVCICSLGSISVDVVNSARLMCIPQYGWGKEYAKKRLGGAGEVAVPSVSSCFSAGDCRLVKLGVEWDECVHLSCCWGKQQGLSQPSAAGHAGEFLSRDAAVSTSSFLPLTGMSPLFTPTLQLWSCLLLAWGVAPV